MESCRAKIVTNIWTQNWLKINTEVDHIPLYQARVHISALVGDGVAYSGQIRRQVEDQLWRCVDGIT